MKPKAVVLLSGGLDSATTIAIAQQEGFEVYALSFRYGQRHSMELHAAEVLAKEMGVIRHNIADIDLRAWGGSSLTDDIELPKDRSVEQMSASIPSTYVPARNTIFLSFALAWAEAIDARDIYIGVNALDYSGYPDCRPEYIEAFTRMANLGTRAGVEGSNPFHIHTPLIELTKAAIIARGLELGVNFARTISCYDVDAEGRGCGRCDTCKLRLSGFSENGIVDPAPYRSAA